MSKTNEQTIKSYNEHLQEFIDGTPHELTSGQKLWIDTALKNLPSNPKILEIGSGFGKDSVYIESKGFSVIRTDAAQSFVNYLNNNEQPAKLLNVVTDEIEGKYDMVFANTVFLHFNPEELGLVLTKIHAAVNEGGILAFSVSRGSGSEWSDAKIGAPRFFQYWELDALTQELEANNFRIIWLPDKTSDEWLHIIAKPK